MRMCVRTVYESENECIGLDFGIHIDIYVYSTKNITERGSIQTGITRNGPSTIIEVKYTKGKKKHKHTCTHLHTHARAHTPNFVRVCQKTISW